MRWVGLGLGVGKERSPNNDLQMGKRIIVLFPGDVMRVH